MQHSYVASQLQRGGFVPLSEVQAQCDAPHLFVDHLVATREIYLCRLPSGMVGAVTRHLMFCLYAVCCEQPVPPIAQDVYDWLCDNEGASLCTAREELGLGNREFSHAVGELQRFLRITPLKLIGPVEREMNPERQRMSFWITDGFWFSGLCGPAQYANIGYCMAEIRRLLGPLLPYSALNKILYQTA